MRNGGEGRGEVALIFSALRVDSVRARPLPAKIVLSVSICAHQELITKLGENKDKITESTSVWDDIYDWADSNFVQVIVQKNEQNVQSETEPIQDNGLKKDF